MEEHRKIGDFPMSDGLHGHSALGFWDVVTIGFYRIDLRLHRLHGGLTEDPTLTRPTSLL